MALKVGLAGIFGGCGPCLDKYRVRFSPAIDRSPLARRYRSDGGTDTFRIARDTDVDTIANWSEWAVR